MSKLFSAVFYNKDPKEMIHGFKAEEQADGIYILTWSVEGDSPEFDSRKTGESTLSDMDLFANEIKGILKNEHKGNDYSNYTVELAAIGEVENHRAAHQGYTTAETGIIEDVTVSYTLNEPESFKVHIKWAHKSIMANHPSNLSHYFNLDYRNSNAEDVTSSLAESVSVIAKELESDSITS